MPKEIGRGESSASVIDSFRHAISIKEPDTYSNEAQCDWPMYGSPEKIATDGGPGYTSVETASFCLESESQLEVVATGKGWNKPYIESFFATLRQQFAKSLPGYCGKYADQRELDFTVKQQACMTKEQFESALTHWIVDEYHQSPHKGLLGKTPYETWKEGALLFAPSIPANYNRIRYTKGQVEQRTIQGEHGGQGIMINNLYYSDEEGILKGIHAQLKQQGKEKRVTCEYSPNDISSINIINPTTHEVFVAYCHNPNVYERMTLAEYQAKYPQPKKKKGFGHLRVARDSQVLKDVQELHRKKTQPKAKKSRSFKSDELTDQIKHNQDHYVEPNPFHDDVPEDQTQQAAKGSNGSNAYNRQESYSYE